MSLWSFLFGKSQRTQQLPLLNTQQQQVQNQFLQYLLQQLGQGAQGAEQGFAPIEELSRTQFREETIPGLAERFTAMGNGQRSSAFQKALGQAGSGLETQLAALRGQYGLQRQGQLGQLLGLGLQPRTENILQPRQPGLFENLLTPVAGAAAQPLGMRLGTSLGQRFF